MMPQGRVKSVRINLLLGVCVLLSACGASTESNSSDATTQMKNIFADPKWRAEFVDSCVQGATNKATGSGVTADAIKPICECAADELPKKVTAEEMAAQNRAKIMPVMEQCAKKVLGAPAQ